MRKTLGGTLTATIALFIVACGGSGTDSESLTEGGVWDGTINNSGTNDVVYWNFAANGVLTRYDFQQDGIPSASGQNCYVVSEPITVTPEGGEDYSIGNVAVTAVVTGESLNITFLEADENDLDENGDTEEMPVFIWTRLSSPVLEDLNNCTLSTIDTEPSNESAADAALNIVIPDPPTDEVSLSTFFSGSFDDEAMTGGGFALLQQAGSSLLIRGVWGRPNSYYEVNIFINETTDGTYPLASGSSGISQIIGGDAVAETFSNTGEASDTVTFVRDRNAGLIAGNFAFTVLGDDNSRVNVSGEFNTAIAGDSSSLYCNFDDEVISICWFGEE